MNVTLYEIKVQGAKTMYAFTRNGADQIAEAETRRTGGGAVVSYNGQVLSKYDSGWIEYYWRYDMPIMAAK